MKKILFIILLPTFLFAQSNATKSIIELKNQVRTTLDQKDNILLQPNREKKNAGLAIIYSLILPGMGELYADGYDSGVYFTVADAVFWGTFAGLNIYGDWKKNNYRAFAESTGRANLNGKDDQFFANMGNYQDVYEYNKEQELNRNFDAVYDVNTHYWKWNSNEQRREYRGMWVSSENAYNNIRFAVGALILNRLVSAINAVRLVSAYNKKVDGLSWNVSVGMNNYTNLPTSLNLNFTTTF